jgi:D-alanyl-lipoteichoic acid acyltransferase DltB (MBOAT superfamily)
MDIILPVGISFYTFQSISYIVDVYRRRVEPTDSWLEYIFFLSFFPALVAGPIVRADQFLPQIKANRTPSKEEVWWGFWLILLGVVKKSLLADYIAQYNDIIFTTPETYTGFENLMAMLGYTMQIYCDFSGYSDMAIGIALIMGYSLPKNFNFPYKSQNVSEFWHRWHISLSSWLRDYLYIPLGGNRKGAGRTYVNLFLTMLLGGLWHGASWTFMLWGAYHGTLLALERMMGKHGLAWRLPRPLQIGLTFVLVMFGWLLFRATTLAGWARMAKGLAGANGWGVAYPLADAGALNWGLWLFCLVLVFAAKNTWEIRWQPRWRLALGLAVLFLICVGTFLVNTSSPFLYFQF